MADRPWCGWCGEALFGDYNANDIMLHRVEPLLHHADGRPARHEHGIWVRWGAKSFGPGLTSTLDEPPALFGLPTPKSKVTPKTESA
jgi:hypothetical protein